MASESTDKRITLLATLPFALAALFASMLPARATGAALTVTVPWAPTLGVNLSLYIDGLSQLFVLIITVVGGFVFLYAPGYMGRIEKPLRFYGTLTAFTLAMVGLVVADHLLVMFIFWEITTLTSYLLVGWDHESAKARFNARQALLITGAGGLALLAGLLLIGITTGAWSLTTLLAAPDLLKGSSVYPWILALVLLGAFTKSAQFPFISGCPTPWWPPRPSARICTRQPWSRQAST